MPANGRWDLIRRLKIKLKISQGILKLPVYAKTSFVSFHFKNTVLYCHSLLVHLEQYNLLRQDNSARYQRNSPATFSYSPLKITVLCIREET
jgi:hypothetical protein